MNSEIMHQSNENETSTNTLGNVNNITSLDRLNEIGYESDTNNFINSEMNTNDDVSLDPLIEVIANRSIITDKSRIRNIIDNEIPSTSSGITANESIFHDLNNANMNEVVDEENFETMIGAVNDTGTENTEYPLIEVIANRSVITDKSRIRNIIDNEIPSTSSGITANESIFHNLNNANMNEVEDVENFETMIGAVNDTGTEITEFNLNDLDTLNDCVINHSDGKTNAENKTEKLCQFPLGRIKSIIKADPEITVINAESIFLICKATELFLQQIGKEMYSITLRHKKKTLQKKDLEQAIIENSALQFLDGALD